MDPSKPATAEGHGSEGDEPTPPTLGLAPGALPPSTLARARGHAPATPGMLGCYQLKREIGRGGMGMVWLGWDENLNRAVALKLISPEVASDEASISRLKAEARAAAGLNHRGIVNVYLFDDRAEPPYIAMEYVEGRDLARLVREEGPLPPARAVALIREAAQALAFAATRGVVHRDIKPSNIFLTSEGEVKVMDFGLAKCLGGDAGLTGSGEILGTPAYLSPEQALGEAVTFRTDMYSLGCTLFTLLTGDKPFGGATPLVAVVKHAREPLPIPEEWGRVAGGALREVIARMTAKSPGDRYPSWEECIGALRSLEERLASPGETVPITTITAPQRPRWVLPAVAAAACVVLAGLAALAFRGGGNAAPLAAAATTAPPAGHPGGGAPEESPGAVDSLEVTAPVETTAPPREVPGGDPGPGLPAVALAEGPATPIVVPESIVEDLRERAAAGDWEAFAALIDGLDEAERERLAPYTEAAGIARRLGPSGPAGERVAALKRAVDTRGAQMEFMEAFEHVLVLKLMNAEGALIYERALLDVYPPGPQNAALAPQLRLLRKIEGLHGGGGAEGEGPRPGGPGRRPGARGLPPRQR